MIIAIIADRNLIGANKRTINARVCLGKGENMENRIVTLGVYFEIKDADLYGGEGTFGYSNINVDLPISSLLKADICNYVEKQRKGMADMCHVDVEKVKVISRKEYEERTEDEEDFDWED